MKALITAMLSFVWILPSIAQEKKVFLNFFTGVASFNTDVTQIDGDDFTSTTLYSSAPTGISLGVELLKNSYIYFHYGTHRLHNDYLKVTGENYGATSWNRPASARNFGVKLKYEINLLKTLKIIPFVGYSTSFISQPSGSYSAFEIRSKSSSTSSVNGVVTDVKRDSIFSSTEFITNNFSGLSAGGELVFDFKNNLGIYLSYSFFHSSKYYAIQYGEYRSTAISTQKAYTAFGRNGQFYLLGLRYHIFNY
ncbi:MAG: hypothetical protein AB8B74_14790 [Crocinitomicaceae bacterium]